MVDAGAGAARRSLQGCAEIEADQHLYELARQTIRQQPGMFLYSSIVRLGYLWSPLAHRVDPYESPRGLWMRSGAAVWYVVVFALAIVGAVRGSRGTAEDAVGLGDILRAGPDAGPRSLLDEPANAGSRDAGGGLAGGGGVAGGGWRAAGGGRRAGHAALTAGPRPSCPTCFHEITYDALFAVKAALRRNGDTSIIPPLYFQSTRLIVVAARVTRWLSAPYMARMPYPELVSSRQILSDWLTNRRAAPPSGCNSIVRIAWVLVGLWCAAPWARADIQMPVPDPAASITIDGESAEHWQQGAVEAWVVRALRDSAG